MGRGSASRPAVHLHIDLADVHIGRDFTVVLPPESEEAAPQARLGLSGLLERVRRVWVDQVLDELVPDGVLLDIHPSRLMSRETQPDAPAEAPGGPSLITLFEQSGRALLILGEPGSGKTVSLLDLARELVERAEADPAEPVPVVVKLASWSAGAPFAEWLAAELSAFYRVPRRQARRWISERRILPLLDGLDEVAPAGQRACIGAINEYVSDGIPGIAATCRTEAYAAIDHALDVNAAYRVDLLTRDQVVDHIERSGPDLAYLARILHEDDVLLETARTPLMLRLIVEAYRGLSEADVIRDDLRSVERRREHVLDAYAQRAFERAEERPGGEVSFNEDEVISGLAFVARGLRAESERMLLVDRLQPSWLTRRRWRLIYLATTRLGGGLLIGLGLGVLLEIGLTLVGGGMVPFLAEALNRVGFGALIGLGGGMLVAAIDLVRFRRGGGDLRAGKPYLLGIVYLVLFALFGVLLLGGVGGTNVLYGLAAGVMWGVVFWLFFGLTAHDRRLGSDIRMPEALRFSRASARRNAWRGAIAGGGTGAVLEALLGLAEVMDAGTRLVSVALAGIALAAPAAAIGCVAGGLQRGFVRTPSRPNEGFVLALRNMALAGGAIALAATMVLVPLLWLGIGGLRGAALGIVAGVFVGVLAAMWVGGMDVLRHVTLRALLARLQPAARSLVPFLDHAADLGFLQRAGGGFLFVHDVFLEHFASIDPVDEDGVRTKALPTSPRRHAALAQA